MTSLGQTITPGETGTVTTLQHMPDQLPDNPSTLLANTSIETLEQILYRNWVWRNTFTIDQSMQAGHVFGALKIHPRNANDYISHISQMFLTWNGSFKVRTRFMATFQFGGSFRLGFLPPKFKEQEVLNMPIQTLTAYPNVDLDPKNTNWSEFQASDERNVLFHWMAPLEDEDPQSFAGWFVFYVAAPLVISGQVNTVSMLVEAAGAFEFAQLAPIANIAPASEGWLKGATEDLMTQSGCDDTLSLQYIYINPVTVKSLPIGWARAIAPGNQMPEQVTLDAVISDGQKWYRGNRVYTTNAPAKWKHISTSASDIVSMTNDNVRLPINAKPLGVYTGRMSTDVGSPLVTITRKKGIDPADIWRLPAPLLQDPTLLNENNFIALHTDGMTIRPSECVIEEDPTSLPNIVPTESIILFNSAFGVNMQTTAMASALSRSAKPGSEVSQIYQLFRSDHPTAVLTVRLLPNGMFTTRAVDVEAVLIPPPGAYFYLRYLQDLPITSPLPGSSFEARMLRAAKRFARGDRTPDSAQALLYSAV